jgi:hypothetical protein
MQSVSHTIFLCSIYFSYCRLSTVSFELLTIRRSSHLCPAEVTPPSSADDRMHRYSLVFALRPYKEATISTSSLTSEVTGDFQYPLEGVTAQALFNVIAGVET